MPTNRASAAGRVRQWRLVIPVKAAAVGKSRLHVAGADHEVLARAIALDTIAAAARSEAVGSISVVTADAVTSRMLAGLELVSIVPDPAGGLTRALRAGLAAVGSGTDRAVLLGDVPSLQPAELTAALELADSHPRGFVADAEGTGSVLATARSGVPLPILFGPGSADAHGAAGFEELPVPVHAGLRRDVDLAAHLRAAPALGERTTAALAARLVRTELVPA